MRLLLDTHILVWFALTPAKLSETVATSIISPENTIYLSAASAWEISIKRAVGRLEFPLEKLPTLLSKSAFEALPISVTHAIAAGELPRLHNDPFDRVLIAQAQMEQLILVTEDAAIRRYDVPILG